MWRSREEPECLELDRGKGEWIDVESDLDIGREVNRVSVVGVDEANLSKEPDILEVESSELL